jgi:hypothetical protein
MARLDRVHDEYADYYRECEEVSRSSQVAGREPRRPRPEAPPPAPPTPREAARVLLAAMARRAPRPLRRAVPRATRERLLSPPSGGPGPAGGRP